MMSASTNGVPDSPLNRVNDAVGEDSADPSISRSDSAGRMGFGTMASDEKKATFSFVGTDNSVEIRVSAIMNEKVENEESRLIDAYGGALENSPSSSYLRGYSNGKKTSDVRNRISESKKVKGAVTSYGSILSMFDRFASNGAGEVVGFGYETGDMVWGKVKSHPWWPGQIYNEAFASPSVQRSKREGHVLVAFFGDSSYGWFDPAELVPFEEKYGEKSRQTSSRAFLKAVEEAVDEISRRQGLGLACCCRNEFNFCPSSMEGYFVVDVGDYEPGVYSLRQISKAREDFRTKEMLFFVKQLALTHMTDQQWKIEFVKNKATVLACRKAFFEEFDETYAQAFGTVPERPPRPSAPMALDPAKAPLSGPLVFAEALGNGKVSVKPNKSKEQLEKEKYLFIRRDPAIHTKTKKTSSVQVVVPVESDIEKHMHQTSLSGSNNSRHQSSSDGQKKLKLRKRRAGESSAENANLDMKKKKKKRKIEADTENVKVAEMKRKKDVRNEGNVNIGQLLPLANNDNVAVEKVSGALFGGASNQLDNRKKDDDLEAQEAVELSLLVRDLRALALDPLHGVERNCPASTRLLFLKYRSVVYQKSLVSLPLTGNETIEPHATKTPALSGPTDDSTMKLVKLSTRPINDPTKGGKKRGLPDRPESVKKKKLLVDPAEGINERIKIVGSEDLSKKKKIIDDSKLVALGKKIPQTSSESQRRDWKEIQPKAVKHDSSSSKRLMAQKAVRTSNPTMLVLKFPAGSALPSGPQLRAKFARYGTLDLDATRVFWKTHTCRLVYLRKNDAEEALRFAVGSNNLFGSTNLRCYIRELGVEASSVEAESVKREEHAFEHNSSVRPAGGQLKSCLKKPLPNNDGGDNGTNGNGRGTRVKFVLGGEGSHSKTREQVSNCHASSHNNDPLIDSTSIKNLPKLTTPHSSLTTPLPPITNNHFQKFPFQQTPSSSTKDISPQFLNLLTRCRDLVNNVTGVLGYMPYHAL